MCARKDVRAKFGITHVLTCVSLYGFTRHTHTHTYILHTHTSHTHRYEESYPPDKDEIARGKWHVIRLADAATSDLLSHLETATDFVHTSILNGGKIAVHSLEGVSRAASLVIAYLMKYRSLNLQTAFDKVAKKRPDVRVNRGFWRQLHAYEFYLKGKNSILDEDLPGAIIFEADIMAAIVKRFRDKHSVTLVENPSPRIGKIQTVKLTGGAFCGSPRKSKQPFTPKMEPKRGIGVDEFHLDSTLERQPKRRKTLDGTDT